MTQALSDNEMLLRLVERNGCSEVEVVARLLASRNEDASRAFIIHHDFVAGGRSMLNGMPEFFQKQCQFGT